MQGRIQEARPQLSIATVREEKRNGPGVLKAELTSMIGSQLPSPSTIAPALPACRCPELPTFRFLLPRALGQPVKETITTASFAAKGRPASSSPSSLPAIFPSWNKTPERPSMAAAAGGESGPGGAPRIMIVSDLDNTMVRGSIPGWPLVQKRSGAFLCFFEENLNTCSHCRPQPCCLFSWYLRLAKIWRILLAAAS